VVEGALKQGNPEEAAWLLDEGGEEAVGGAARRPRWALFDAPEGGGHAAAAEELRERAPRGLRFCEDFDFGPQMRAPLLFGVRLTQARRWQTWRGGRTSWTRTLCTSWA
jgi:hypothetical protein